MPLGFRVYNVDELRFERVADGWLFEVASPWMFGQVRTYLVTDAQKPCVADQLKRSLCVQFIVTCCVVLVIIAAHFKHPFLVGANEITLLWAPVYAFCAVMECMEHLIVGRSLRGAPRTTQKISRAHIWHVLSKTTTVRTLALRAVIFGFGAAVNIYIVVIATEQAYATLAAACAGVLAVFSLSSGAGLFIMLRTKPIAEIDTKAI